MTSERHKECWRLVLEHFIILGPSTGLCHALEVTQGILDPERVELQAQLRGCKPAGCTTNFWWPLDSHGFHKRLQVLHGLIHGLIHPTMYTQANLAGKWVTAVSGSRMIVLQVEVIHALRKGWDHLAIDWIYGVRDDGHIIGMSPGEIKEVK